jgi:serine/threonine-protein kinase
MPAAPGPALPHGGAPAPGQRIDRFRVERLIARGAHGVMLAVTDLAAGDGPDALRALKLFAPADGLDAAEAGEAGRRFAREAATLQRLRHPGIVHVHRAGETGGRPWLLMELLAGCDLTRYTRPARRLPEPVVARIGERIARALAHAHAQSVVHRDLKPANVMVDWASDRVVLTDFGVAAVSGLADAERTRTGVVLGSPSYMAPELLAGQPAAPGSDLYALGVLLFELLTGRLPFDAPGLGELLRQVATAPAPDPAALRAGVPPALSALVRQLLAKSPGDRPASATELADRLAVWCAAAADDPPRRG